MNDLDLCLEVFSLEIEAWFQRTTNRKWPTGNQIVTWPMMSRDPEQSNSWPQ